MSEQERHAKGFRTGVSEKKQNPLEAAANKSLSFDWVLGHKLLLWQKLRCLVKPLICPYCCDCTIPPSRFISEASRIGSIIIPEMEEVNYVFIIIPSYHVFILRLVSFVFFCNHLIVRAPRCTDCSHFIWDMFHAK
jgi:hypothetical protein